MTSGVVVIGGGLLGLSSAWYLRQAGFDVTLVERNQDVGLESSFANGGLLTPSMPEPWNSPGVHWHLLRYLGRKDAPMLLRPQAIHHYLGWGARFLRNSTPRHYLAASLANLALARFSLSEVQRLRQAGVVEYSHGSHGSMKLFRDPAGFEAARLASEPLCEAGLVVECLDSDASVRAEPFLAEMRGRLAGSLYYPEDETGDALEFCRSLRDAASARGVAFAYGDAVDGLVVEAGRVRAVVTGTDSLAADIVVCAAGVWSPRLLSRYGIRLAVRPVKGYSVTIPIQEGMSVPRGGIIDDALHAGIVTLGDKLRLVGTAEFCGWNQQIDPDRIDNLFNLLSAMSPTLAGQVDRRSAKEWCGLRPMAADGLPYIGSTAITGLYVNSGHGHLGWTQALGSGALLAQIISGGRTELDASPYSLPR